MQSLLNITFKIFVNIDMMRVFASVHPVMLSDKNQQAKLSSNFAFILPGLERPDYGFYDIIHIT